MIDSIFNLGRGRSGVRMKSRISATILAQRAREAEMVLNRHEEFGLPFVRHGAINPA